MCKRKHKLWLLIDVSGSYGKGILCKLQTEKYREKAAKHFLVAIKYETYIDFKINRYQYVFIEKFHFSIDKISIFVNKQL